MTRKITAKSKAPQGILVGSIYFRKHHLYTKMYEYILPIIERLISSHLDESSMKISFNLHHHRAEQIKMRLFKENENPDEQAVNLYQLFGSIITEFIENDINNRSKHSLLRDVTSIVCDTFQLPSHASLSFEVYNENMTTLKIDYSGLSKRSQDSTVPAVKKHQKYKPVIKQFKYDKTFKVIKRLINQAYYPEFNEIIFELSEQKIKQIKKRMEFYRKENILLLEDFLAREIALIIDNSLPMSSILALEKALKTYVNNELKINHPVEINIGLSTISIIMLKPNEMIA